MEYITTINRARMKIAKGNVKDSFAILYELPLSNKESEELLILESRYSKIISDEIKGIVSFENKNLQFNQIVNSLLSFIQGLTIVSKNSDSIQKQKVIIHFFNCNFDTSELKKLILFQNQKQKLFSFIISNWEYYLGATKLEKSFSKTQFKSRLNFVDEIIKCVHNLPSNAKENDTHLVVTSLPLPRNYYSWNSKDKKGIVISKGTLDRIFEDKMNVNRMIIRVIQRMLVYGMSINDLSAHFDSRGCLFDLTVNIKELETVMVMNYLCDDCVEKIIKDKNGKEAYRKISEWIDNNL